MKFVSPVAVPAADVVVPHEGTWIEIEFYAGMKLDQKVVPHEGTWIEIEYYQKINKKRHGRSPRGNVD